MHWLVSARATTMSLDGHRQGGTSSAPPLVTSRNASVARLGNAKTGSADRNDGFGAAAEIPGTPMRFNPKA